MKYRLTGDCRKVGKTVWTTIVELRDDPTLHDTIASARSRVEDFIMRASHHTTGQGVFWSTPTEGYIRYVPLYNPSDEVDPVWEARFKIEKVDAPMRVYEVHLLSGQSVSLRCDQKPHAPDKGRYHVMDANGDGYLFNWDQVVYVSSTEE